MKILLDDESAPQKMRLLIDGRHMPLQRGSKVGAG